MRQYATPLKQVFVHFPGMGAYERGVVKGCAAYALQLGDILLHHLRGLGHLPAMHDDITASGGAIHGFVVDTDKPQLLEELSRYSPNIVNVANYRHPLNRFSVHSDDTAIGKTAAEYLHSLGYEHFVYFGFVEGTRFSQDRLNGFRSTLSSLGYRSLSIRTSLGALLQDVKTGLRDIPRPAALFTAVDSYGYLLWGQMRLYGISVPEEMAILGVDNDDLANAFSSYELSTIEQDTHTIGYRAMALLDRGGTPADAERRRIVVPPGQLVRRASTNATSVTDWLVLRALRVIRDSGHLPLSVDTVASMLHTPKRTLQRRFREHLGSTVQEQIRLAKLGRAERLLRETDTPVEQVAFACGLDYPRRMRNLFRDYHGMTPTEYRERIGD